MGVPESCENSRLHKLGKWPKLADVTVVLECVQPLTAIKLQSCVVTDLAVSCLWSILLVYQRVMVRRLTGRHLSTARVMSTMMLMMIMIKGTETMSLASQSAADQVD